MRRLALPVFLALMGCGGSSSETPPPLEPDPARLRPGNGNDAPADAAHTPGGVPAAEGAGASPPVIQPVTSRPAAPPMSPQPPPRTRRAGSPQPRVPVLRRR